MHGEPLGTWSSQAFFVRPNRGLWKLTPAGVDAGFPPNPPYYGEIPGLSLGKEFTNHMDAYKNGVHPSGLARAGSLNCPDGPWIIPESESTANI